MNPVHRFDPSILREYDVRGIVGETLSTDDAWALGRAFGTVIARGGPGRVFTAYDGRASSPALEAAVAKGLMEAGVTVSRAGLGPTEQSAFAAHQFPQNGRHRTAPHHGVGVAPVGAEGVIIGPHGGGETGGDRFLADG